MAFPNPGLRSPGGGGNSDEELRQGGGKGGQPKGWEQAVEVTAKGRWQARMSPNTYELTQTWLPFVLGPAFAIDSSPGLVCLIEKFSSSKVTPGAASSKRRGQAGEQHG
jgi:hypothetical protein